jgi:hypothetical protein
LTAYGVLLKGLAPMPQGVTWTIDWSGVGLSIAAGQPWEALRATLDDTITAVTPTKEDAAA